MGLFFTVSNAAAGWDAVYGTKLRTMREQPRVIRRYGLSLETTASLVCGQVGCVVFASMNCPQLLNVLNGEMSLIGPRPERPELEHVLERHIPHYRKRHWMRPALSGWAQVCAPYASSIEDSELKLSYRSLLLRHFSTWLDLVILISYN